MYNEERFTKLTLEQPDKKIVVEFPYTDVNGDDMIQAFKTIMVGMTFTEETVKNIFAGYLSECGLEIYEPHESDEDE